MRQSLIFISVVCVVPLLLSAPADAWNAPGHMVIGLIAYDQMNPPVRAKVLQILRQHPRFEQHFLGDMPQNVWNGSDAEKDQWLFAQATVWPDIVRSESNIVTKDDVTRFSRPVWHYINMPHFLNEEERQRLADRFRPNLSRELPNELDDPFINCIQAVKNSSRIVADESAQGADRAVHLCWLFHLVGDSHQPLHSTALFTSQRFPKGDQGGNLLMIRGKKRLHAYWDGAIMEARNFNQMRREAFDLLSDKEMTTAGERAAAKSLDIGEWIDEGHGLAKQYVYTNHVLKIVSDAEGRENVSSLNPPQMYDVDAGAVAKRRAVEAGYRLSAMLENLLR